MKRVSIGIFAHMGWATTAVVAIDRKRVCIVRTDRIETAKPGDREAREPYHVAGGFDGLARVPQPLNPENALQRGLARQQRHTIGIITRLTQSLADDDYQLVRAGLLVSRGRPASDFAKAIGSHPQIHIQEGLAVRASIAAALAVNGVRVREIDQKSLVAIADNELDEVEPKWSEHLDAITPDNDGAWRKEEKQAAIAAWLALRRVG